MSNALIRSSALLAVIGLVPCAAAAAPKPFTGPTGWTHTVVASATAQSPRAEETWKKPDGEQVVYLEDGGLGYDDMVGLVKKNIADNALKTSVDTDRKCDGRRAFEVEMTLGAMVYHQVIIDDAPGVTKLTYTRPLATPASPDVMSVLNAYCGAIQ